MPKTSRREFLTGIALLGASTFVRGAAESAATSATPSSAGVSWAASERKAASDRLLAYFGKAAPQLLRPAQGVLKWR